jgi:CBS domain-containing protein
MSKSLPTAGDVMARDLVTLAPETDIHEAMRTLLKRKISGAPVVDADRRLVGVLSEKDCLRVLTAEAFDGRPLGHVADYMTRAPHAIEPEAGLVDIVGRFLASPYRRLPVVDAEGRLLGQVSRRDALAAVDAIRDNSYLYGSRDQHPPDEDDAGGVATAMRRAREQ